MSTNRILEEISRLEGGDGELCDYGCAEEDVPDLITLSKKILPIKPYRVVRKWCWADLEVDEQEAEFFTQRGAKPAFLFASEIVEDERRVFTEGSAVRTTILVEFYNNCLFVTRNTVYILVGQGRRMTVTPAVYSSIIL